jgi:hypothetical protein
MLATYSGLAGSPLKRQRRKELRCIQPRIPMHQWRTFSDTEKIVVIFGMSLDEVLELMSIPFAEADLYERNLKLRVFECMMKAVSSSHETVNAPTHATRSSSASTPPCTHTSRTPMAEGEPRWQRRSGTTAASKLTVPLAFLNHCSAVSH